MSELNITWKIYFLRMAYLASWNTKCLSRRCGAVLVKGKSVVSTGYNGPPVGIDPCDHRNLARRDGVCPRKKMDGYESGKFLDYCPAGHGEQNAILQAARWGIATEGCTLVYAGQHPCKWCMITIINAGIKKIVCLLGDYDTMGPQLAEEAGIIVERVNVTTESLIK